MLIISIYCLQTGCNFFKIPSNLKLLNRKNVYLPKKSEKLIKLPSAATTPDDDCSFFSNILDSYTGKNKKANNQLMSLSLKAMKAPEHSTTTSVKPKLTNTWENLADEEIPPRCFSSESAEPIYLRLVSPKSKAPVEVRVIPFQNLLADLKLLAIGIESESFKRAANDSLTFETPRKLSCADISDISQFVAEFIETGTCFKRLKTFTSKNSFNQSYIFEGFIFKAFCDCIIKFMNYYRDIVHSQEVETLLEFASNTKNIRRILIHITKFLKIHPSSTCRSMLPSGSDFLGMLYSEYTTIFNSDVKCFFVECLKSCCQIYFNNFHRWLFQGFIDDPHRELFIYFVGHYRPNTKYFFDKAYLVRKQSVPGFLQGCADNILLCGKYTMLLKSYNQVHPLFMLQKPTLKVCLTNEEMTEMRAQCKEFTKAARAACGPSISIEELMTERTQSKKEMYKKSEAAAVVNMQRWRQEQEERRIELAEKREIQLKGLRAELARIEERKLQKRREEVQAEFDYLDAAEEHEKHQLEKENVELQRRIEIYEKLHQQLDEGTERRDKIVTGLKNTLESKQDAINANETESALGKPTDDSLNTNDWKQTTSDSNEVSTMANESERVTLETKEDSLNANEPSLSTELPPTDEMNNVISKTTLSEAQRNKLKVLSHEYNFSPQQSAVESPATPTEGQNLTQAQKNKLRVMGHDFGMIAPSTALPPTIQIQSFESMTDLQKNRLKVLSHEFNIQESAPTKAPPKTMSLSLLQIETTTHQHLESPMSVTSDHFSNECDTQHVDHDNKSPDDSTEMEKSQIIVDDEESEMLKAFEDAVERNSSMFMGINLNDLSTPSNYQHIRTTEIMALSSFLQMSLMTPVTAYMDILNNETLKMFFKDLDILSHFKSLRNYFLMMNGEFGSSICHQLFSKLESGVRPIELLNYQSLHMILDHALSQSRQDGNTEQLSFIVQSIPEKFELHSPAVLNMLTMSYKLEWPLNLILNPETMEQYQAIFNYLLKLKRISWVLEECFQIMKEVHKEHGKDLLKSQQYRNAQQIRHKMTHFVHCLENHVTRNVLQISWRAFVDDLKKSQSIHCIYRKHTSYLKRVLFLCLLNKKSFEFQKTIEDSFKVILRFHK